MFCEASSHPKPTIRWEFDSKNTSSRYELPGRGVLSISNINRNDSGRIKCIAENLMGRDYLETTLIVHTMPECSLASNRVSAPEGTSLSVVCTAAGNPFPTLKWGKAFGELVGQQVYSNSTGTLTLKFNSLTVLDAGYYTCEAVNKIGRSESSVFLDVDFAEDCSGYKGNRTSGIYTINPDGKQPFAVFCDMETNRGGWTVLLRRSDGSVDFFKDWFAYKTGFGRLSNDFWLGNDKIHRLTFGKNMVVRFDLEDFDGNKVFAEYRQFYIDGESDKYKAHIGAYSGTAGDSFGYSNGLLFSTKDRDHDTYAHSCAAHCHSAWWFGTCSGSSITGRYLRPPHHLQEKGIHWDTFKGVKYSLKHTEMKVRPAGQ